MISTLKIAAATAALLIAGTAVASTGDCSKHTLKIFTGDAANLVIVGHSCNPDNGKCTSSSSTAVGSQCVFPSNNTLAVYNTKTGDKGVLDLNAYKTQLQLAKLKADGSAADVTVQVGDKGNLICDPRSFSQAPLTLGASKNIVFCGVSAR